MSVISAALIAIVSAVSITVLAWIYPPMLTKDAPADIKTEISWGQGS